MSRQVKITIGDEDDGANKEKQKEVPIWISQSTVGRSEGGEDVPAAVAQSVALESMAASDDDGDGGAVEQNDEITSLLLRHERKSNATGAAAGFGAGGGAKGKSKKNYIPGMYVCGSHGARLMSGDSGSKLSCRSS